MGAERSAVAAWVASWDDRERRAALAGLAEKTRALREAFGRETEAGEAELLAGAVFLEYAERVGVCPLELHWILGDAAAASAAAVGMVRVQMMVEDAAGRRDGVTKGPGQETGRRRTGREAHARGREGGEQARLGDAPSSRTETRRQRGEGENGETRAGSPCHG